MKYKKYPKYKNSGIEWLGEIPKHWDVIKNKHIFKHRPKIYNQSEDTPVLSLTINGIKIKTDLSFGKSTESYIGHQLVYPSEIVFTPRDFDQTPILSGVSEYFGCISNLYFVLQTNNLAYNKFVNYFWWGLKYGVDYFKNFSEGIRYSFNREQFNEIIFLKPPLSEQKAIANFLDKATAKIDNLIQKEEELIKLLEEKKEALITKAVTKGLKEAKLKDSGIEWLGKIPEHWEVRRLKFIFDYIQTGKTPSTKIIDELPIDKSRGFWL